VGGAKREIEMNVNSEKSKELQGGVERKASALAKKEQKGAKTGAVGRSGEKTEGEPLRRNPTAVLGNNRRLPKRVAH